MIAAVALLLLLPQTEVVWTEGEHVAPAPTPDGRGVLQLWGPGRASGEVTAGAEPGRSGSGGPYVEVVVGPADFPLRLSVGGGGACGRQDGDDALQTSAVLGPSGGVARAGLARPRQPLGFSGSEPPPNVVAVTAPGSHAGSSAVPSGRMPGGADKRPERYAKVGEGGAASRGGCEPGQPGLARLEWETPFVSNGRVSFMAVEDSELAIGSDEGEVARWGIRRPGIIRRYRVGEGAVLHIARAGPFQLAAATTRDLLVVNLVLGETTRHEVSRDIVGVGTVGRSVAVGQADGNFRFWDLRARTTNGHAAGRGRAVAAAFAGGDRGAMLFDDGRLVVIRFDDRTEWRQEVALAPTSGRPLAMTRSSVAAVDRGGVSLYARGTGALLAHLPARDGRVVHVTASSDHTALLTTTDSGYTEVLSEQGRPIRSFVLDDEELRLQALGAGARLVAVPTSDGRVVLQDVVSGKHLAVHPRHGLDPRPAKARRLVRMRVESVHAAHLSERPGSVVMSVENLDTKPIVNPRVHPRVLPPGVSLVPPSHPLEQIEVGTSVRMVVEVAVSGDHAPGPMPLDFTLSHDEGDHGRVAVTLPLLAPAPRVAQVSVGLDDVELGIANDGDLTAKLLVGVGWAGKRGEFAMTVEPGRTQTLTLDAPGFFGPGEVTVELFDARWPTDAKVSKHPGVGRWRPWAWVTIVGALVGGFALLMAFIYRGLVGMSKRLPSLPLAGIATMARPLQLYRALGIDLLRHAGIPPERWARAVRAAGETAESAAAFAEALGATLGEEERADVLWRLQLPALRLRFPRNIHLAVASGEQLDGGQARALGDTITAASGSPRCVVLDRTVTQDARAALANVPRVGFVVVSEEALRDLLLSADPMGGLQHLMSAQLPRRELSPYRLAGGVEEDMLFFGRAEEIRQLVDRPEWRNAFVIAPRQMGKTSLLKAAGRRARQRDDIEVRFLTLDHSDLVGRLAHELGVPRPEGPDALRALAGGGDKARLWLLDEVDPFVAQDAKDGYPVTRVMRSLSAEGRAYFVLTGLWDLYTAAVLDNDHPLRNFAERILLGPLDERAARELVTEPMRDLAIDWDEDAVDLLLEQTGRRPNLIVIACRELIESLAPDEATLTTERVRSVLRPDGEIANEMKYWRREGPAFRAAFFTGLRMGAVPRAALVDQLRADGLDLGAAEADELFDRLKLSYVLVPNADGDIVCPIPLLRAFVERSGDLAELAAREIERAARGVSESPAPSVAPVVDDDEVL